MDILRSQNKDDDFSPNIVDLSIVIMYISKITVLYLCEISQK